MGKVCRRGVKVCKVRGRERYSDEREMREECEGKRQRRGRRVGTVMTLFCFGRKKFT